MLLLVGMASADMDPTGKQLWPQYFYAGYDDGSAPGLINRPPEAWACGPGGTYEVSDIGCDQMALAWASSGMMWTDYVLSTCVNWEEGGSCDGVGIVYRLQNPEKYYLFLVKDGNMAYLTRYDAGEAVRSDSAECEVLPDTWYVLRVEVLGDVHTAYINGVEILSFSDPAPEGWFRGTGGLAAMGARAYFDNTICLAWPPGWGGGRRDRLAGAITMSPEGRNSPRLAWVEGEVVDSDSPILALRATPNPAAGPVQIAFWLGRAVNSSIDVFDVSGRLVNRIVSESVLPAGFHLYVWDGKQADGRKVHEGVYFCRLRTREDSRTVKILVR